MKRKVVTGLAFCPLLVLIGVEISVSNYDGWGAWAAAPLLLVPAILGFALSLAFLIEMVQKLRAGLSILGPGLLMAVSLVPVIWLMVRRYFV